LEDFECQGQRPTIKVTRDKNALCTPITTRQRTNGMRSQQTTSSGSGRDHPIAAGGDFGGLRAVSLVKDF